MAICFFFGLILYHWLYYVLFYKKQTNDTNEIQLSVKGTVDDEEKNTKEEYSAKSSISWYCFIYYEILVNRNVIRGYLEKRAPLTDFPIYSILIAVAYVVTNIGCVFMYADYYKSFGSLVSANSFLAILPATRNRY